MNLFQSTFAATTESRLLLAWQGGSPEAKAEFNCRTLELSKKYALHFLKWRRAGGRNWDERIEPKLYPISSKTVDAYYVGQPTSTRITTWVYKPVEWLIKQEKQTLFGERTSHSGKGEKKATEQFAELAQKLGRTPTLDEFEDEFGWVQRRHLERTLARDQHKREAAYLIEKYRPALLGEES